MSQIDQSYYVPVSYPELVTLRSKGCPSVPRHSPRIDFTREFFCRKWGSSFNCICPPPVPQGGEAYRPRNPFQGVRNEVESFDYFSALPMRTEGTRPGLKANMSMAKKKGLGFPEKMSKRGLELEGTTRCPNGMFLKPELYSGDSVCGSCVPGSPSVKDPILRDDFPGFDISSDLPFRVCIGEVPSDSPKIRIRTGVERCLKPSRYQDINTVYNLNYTNFFKTKTPKELTLYRIPLAIDKRRPRPTIPVNTNPDLVLGVNNGPIYVNAQPIKWKSCGKSSPPCLKDNRPDFQVIVPGPITVPSDF